MIENALIGLTGAGLGVSAGITVASMLKRIRINGLKMGAIIRLAERNKQNPLVIQRIIAPHKSEDDLPVWMQKWMAHTLHNLERSGSKLSAVRYIALIMFGALAGFVIGITLLQNLPVACLIAVAAFLIPEQVISGRLQAKKFKKIEQLGAAIRVFAAEFADTPQVPRAIAAVARRAPDPLGVVFREAERLVTTGKGPDEICAYLLKELDFEYGRMFVQLLRVAWDDASARLLFGRLASRINGMQSLIQKNRSGLAYSRSMAILVNVLILPATVGIHFLVPETGYFLVHHPAGRLLVCMVFLSMLAGLVMDKMLNEVET